MTRLILAGGGTGGHLYPGIAVAEHVMANGIDVFFLVSDRGIERRVLEGRGYPFFEQAISPLRGRGIGGFVRGVFSLIGQTMRVLGMINKSDTVLLTGGFAAAPAAIAATLKRAKLYLHEQNSVMGMANRLFAPLCTTVFVNVLPTKNAPKSAVAVGYPVRKDVKNIPVKPKLGRNLLVIGGSQGSRFINTLVAGAAKMLVEDGWTIRHQAGGKLIDEAKETFWVAGFEDDPRVSVIPYIDDMAEAYAWADVVVARSGAGGVAETLAARRPAVFIPFAAAADDHQTANAEHAVRLGVAHILNEKEATPDTLTSALLSITNDYEDDIRPRLEVYEKPEAVTRIVKGMNL